MSDYFIVDVHTHAYETKEIGIDNMAGNGQFELCGTIEELSEIMSIAGIDVAIQLSVIADRNMIKSIAEHSELTEQEWNTTKLKIVNHIKIRNHWTCSNAATNEKLKPFIYLDPLMGTENMISEISDKVENFGAKGIKIYPGLGRYFPSDPLLYPVYETAIKLEIPVISHGGLFPADKEYTAPRNFVEVFKNFPNLKFIIAHLGRVYYDEILDISEKFPNVYFDTSSAIPGDANGNILRKAEKFLGPLLSDDEAVNLIRKIGVERVMFGSDYPWFHPGYDVKRILNLQLSETEKQKILGLNARNVIKL